MGFRPDSSKTIMTLYAFDPDLEYTKKLVNNKNLTLDEIIKLDQEQKEKLPAISVGLSSAGVWKDVLQDTVSEGQFVPQDSASEGHNILPEIEDIIVNLIKENNKITREEIGKKLNVSEKTIGRYIAKMKNKINFVGRGQNGHWEIIETE